MSATGFFALGGLVTLYQAYRGFMFQWLLPEARRWSKSQRVLLLCLSDSLFYGICAASGVFALHLAAELSSRLRNPSDIALGTSVLLAFLALWGVLGITGQLPVLLQQGKLQRSGT
jgi:hypothetical protein